MFLICNGILVFLAKTSVSSSSSSCVGKKFSSATELYSEVKAPLHDVTRTTESDSLKNVALAAEEDQEQEDSEEKKKEQGYLSREEEREKEALGAEGEDEEEEVVEATEGENTEDTQISTDELNKRIEDFIRRTKEELRIEAQRQLITV